MVLRSNIAIALLSIVTGAVARAFLVTSPKLSHDIGAHIPLFAMAAGGAWLVLMIIRHIVLDREARRG